MREGTKSITVGLFRGNKTYDMALYVARVVPVNCLGCLDTLCFGYRVYRPARRSEIKDVPV